MTKEEKIGKIEEIAGIYSYFTIPDNYPGDGWEGTLCREGAYCYGHNHFEGEFIKYEEVDEDLLDTILDEGEFEE